jgi:hypothetical protein
VNKQRSIFDPYAPYDPYGDGFDQGYRKGFAMCRKETWLVIVLTAWFAGLSGFIAGMAITDFAL